jgi:uncharacterized protein (DUF1800 family)
MGNPITRRELLRMGKASAFSEKIHDDSVVRTNSGIAPLQGSLTKLRALHLLRRATFGASKEHVDLLVGKSITEAVNLLVDNPVQPSTKPVNSYQKVFNKPNQNVDTQGCAFGNVWVDHIPPVNWQQDPDLGSLDFYRAMYSLVPWWFGQMINQPMHVQEKLNLFWVNQFSAVEEDNRQGKALWRYYTTIRNHTLGNFKTLIKDITVDPNMLFFLNGHFNTASAPDENYGRELQELFTLGRDAGYDQIEDVKAAAKVLTGWRRKTETDGTYTSFFDPARHSTVNKQFSGFYDNKIINGKTGTAGSQETDELIDMIFAKPDTAKFICRRLYKWFVYYKIDAAAEANVIAPLADIFRNNNYNIAPVIKALLSSEHFFDEVNVGVMIKSPVDLYVGMLREFKVQLASSPVDKQYGHWRYFKDRCDAANQRLADPPDVAGWPAYYQEPVFYRFWITADTINKRLKALNLFTKLGNPSVFSEGIPIKVNSISYNQLFLSPGDPNAVVDNFAMFLLPNDVTVAQKANMKSILLSGQTTDSYWTTSWNNYIANPSNQMFEKEVRDRLDGLIDYITSLEEYQLV